VSLSHKGEVQWEKNMGPVSGGHGFGASPILYQDLVILNNDQENEKGNLFALHATNGEVAWTVPRRSKRISYSVPCVFQEKLVFVNWQHGFTAIDPADGSVVDEKSVFNLKTNERAISSPVVVGELVIGTCGFTANPKHCVAMKMTGGKWEEVWRIEKNVPHIPCVVASGSKELVFLWDDSGIVTCVETATGKPHWKERLPNMQGTCFGSPVTDGKHIFCADESGNIHVIAASKDFNYLAFNPLGESCKTTPAIADGKMYVRTAETLHAIKP
jgi:outer membrane protein assembly factor BamB